MARKRSPTDQLFRRLRVVGRIVSRSVKKPGEAPGTMVHTGIRRTEEVHIEPLVYDEAKVHQAKVDTLDECLPFAPAPAVTWLNIDGLHDVDLLRDLGHRIKLHPLVLEDIVHIGQRPKVEDYEEHLYIVIRMLRYDEASGELSEEQISIVLGPNYVVSFQEQHGDVWEPVRERIRAARGQIRNRGADYLAYALIDAIVDGYFNVLENIADRMEAIENTLLDDAGRNAIAEVHHIKRELLIMRKAVWPVRDMLSSTIRDESPLIDAGTRVFLRDAYDHAIQVIDSVETLRDLAASMIDLYLSTTSNRMNEIMKVLTIMATMFIPLTFLAGIYGMNFEYMPELSYPWAYPALLGVMAAVLIGMVLWFRRKGWW